MRKHFRKIIIIIAVFLLLFSLFACNKKGGDSSLNRDKVVDDFAALALEKVDSSFRLDLTSEQINSLDQPLLYIIAKNSSLFMATVLKESQLRSQKIVNINSYLRKNNAFENVSEDKFELVKSTLFMLSDAGLTSEDIADLVYTLLEFSATNIEELLTDIKVQLIAFKIQLKEEDFDSAAEFNDAIVSTDNFIEQVESYQQSATEALGGKALLNQITESKHSLNLLFQVFSKSVLMLNTSALFSLQEKVVEKDSASQIVQYQFNATADEMASYISGIRQSLSEIGKDISQSEYQNLMQALEGVVDILDVLPVAIFSAQINMMIKMSIATLPVMKHFGDMFLKALEAIDKNVVSDYMKLNNEEYDLNSSSILVAKLFINALRDKTAAEVKSKINAYTLEMSTDVASRTNQALAFVLLGSVLVGENSIYAGVIEEEELVRILLVYLLDYQKKELKDYYKAYKAGLENYKGKKTSIHLYELVHNLVDTFSQFETGFELEHQWDSLDTHNAIVAECDRLSLELLDDLIDNLSSIYNEIVDDFFTNKYKYMDELSKMPLQKSTGSKYARLLELNEILGLERVAELLFKMK